LHWTKWVESPLGKEELDLTQNKGANTLHWSPFGIKSVSTQLKAYRTMENMVNLLSQDCHTSHLHKELLV
jgi:vacuolar-type H+-ATPase subunit C/Vma6